MCVRRWESAEQLPPAGESKCNPLVNPVTQEEARRLVFMALPADRSAAGSLWEGRGAAGLKKHGRPNTEGACDYLK